MKKIYKVTLHDKGLIGQIIRTEEINTNIPDIRVMNLLDPACNKRLIEFQKTKLGTFNHITVKGSNISAVWLD